MSFPPRDRMGDPNLREHRGNRGMRWPRQKAPSPILLHPQLWTPH